MTMIVGGKLDQFYTRARIDAVVGAAGHKVSIDRRFHEARERLACYYGQFDKIPVMRNGKVIAQANGAYIAKLFRRCKQTKWIATQLGFIKMRHDHDRQRTRKAFTVQHWVIERLEREDTHA